MKLRVKLELTEDELVAVRDALVFWGIPAEELTEEVHQRLVEGRDDAHRKVNAALRSLRETGTRRVRR